MDNSERQEIERACERLVTQYCHFVDHGAKDRVFELFAEDGIFNHPAGTMTGRAGIIEGVKALDIAGLMSRHVCSNLLIDVVDENNATGVVYFQVYRHEGEVGRRVSPLTNQPVLVGDYRDTFVRTDEGWKFKRRDVIAVFYGAG